MKRKIAIVIGSGGLIGSAVSEHFIRQGWNVKGIDNDARGKYFGSSASVASVIDHLERTYPGRYSHRKEPWVSVCRTTDEVGAVVYCAGQPSHERSVGHPLESWDENAASPVRILETVKDLSFKIPFVFMSTNKVYGEHPNLIPVEETESRLDVTDTMNPFYKGIGETMSVDQTMHTPFGAAKLAADLMVQEYARTYGMPATVLRLGCVTGARHRGVESHGFLSWLFDRLAGAHAYRVFGFGGKQVRDNLHADDVASAVWEVVKSGGSSPGEVYNLGGSRANSTSILEVWRWISRKACSDFKDPFHFPTLTFEATPRKGDHRWYITDTSKFQSHYPSWKPRVPLNDIFEELLAKYRRPHAHSKRGVDS